MGYNNQEELVLREVQFLKRLCDFYQLKAKGAQAAFEAIAALAVDTDSLANMADHLTILESHCHLEDKDLDFWHGEKEFYDLAKRLFNEINITIKEEK